MSQQQNIAPEIKKLALSAELYDKSEKIGDMFGLHIDQIGELDKEIRQILLRISDSSDFIENISKNLEIDAVTAGKIAREVSKEIFDSVKSSMQMQTEQNDQSVSSLERVGGFEVEKPEIETDPNGVTSADKASILAGVEDPQPSIPVMQGSPTHVHSVDAPTNLPTGTPTWSRGQESGPAQQVRSTGSRPSPSVAVPTPKPIQKPSFSSTPVAPKNDQHTEPLVDFLLGNTTASPAQKVVSQPIQPKPAATAPQAPRKSGPDPYREAVQ